LNFKILRIEKSEKVLFLKYLYGKIDRFYTFICAQNFYMEQLLSDFITLSIMIFLCHHL